MALIAKRMEYEQVEPISAGMHIAKCYAVIDLGVQHSDIWDKDAHKVLLIWETDEMMKTKEGEEKPKAISKEFTLSLSEKAALYKDLVSWRGKAFTTQELEGFDLKNVLGAACLLNIVEEKKENRTYAKIGGITPLMKDQVAFKGVNNQIYFELDKNTLNEINNLPQWIGEKIKKSETYKELTKREMVPLTKEEEDGLPF